MQIEDNQRFGCHQNVVRLKQNTLLTACLNLRQRNLVWDYKAASISYHKIDIAWSAYTYAYTTLWALEKNVTSFSQLAAAVSLA